MTNTEFDNEVHRIYKVITYGGVFLYPTDTIWGIGCDALNQDAVNKIYEIKKRPKNLPFIYLVSSLEMLKSYVEIHPKLETLLSFHKRPLTIIYNKTHPVCSPLLSDQNTVAFRITMDPFCKAIINSLLRPIVSTSANLSGSPFPKNFGEISPSIIDQMDYTVKWRQNDLNEYEPSILAKCSEKGDLIFIRS